MTLWGDNSIFIDSVVTAVCVAELVTLFSSRSAKKAAANGVVLQEKVPRFLALLPKKPYVMALIVGGIGAAVLGFLVVLVFTFWIEELPFVYFALLKAAYTAVWGALVCRWTLIKHFALAGSGLDLSAIKRV